MPRRGENIYKRKDGKWEGRYIKEKTNAGKSKYGYVYGKTYREVKQKLHSKLILKHSGDDNRSEIITFNTIAIEWLDEIKPTVKVSTWNKYYNLLHLYVLPELGEFAICDITPNVIQISTKQLLITGGSKNSGLSAKTVSDIVSVIRSVLRHASTKGIALNNDIQSIKIRQSPKDLRVLSLAEQETLVHHLLNNSNDYNAGILVCLFTGLRIGEICALRWDDISLDEHTIHVHQTMQRVQNTQSESKKTQIIFTEPKSRCSIRTIPNFINSMGNVMVCKRLVFQFVRNINISVDIYIKIANFFTGCTTFVYGMHFN